MPRFVYEDGVVVRDNYLKKRCVRMNIVRVVVTPAMYSNITLKC